MLRSEVRNNRQRLAANRDDTDLGRRHKPDYWLIIISACLLAIGVIVVYAIGPALSVTTNLSSSYYTTRQMIAIGLSIIAFIITASIPLKNWKKLYKILLGFAIGATLLAIALPVNPAYPAHRWVRLSSLSFQSVELVKFAVVIWLACFLAKAISSQTVTDSKKTLRPILIALFVIGALVAGIQSDLGSTAVIMAIMGSMAFVAGLPMKRVVIIVLIIIAGMALLISSTPYRRARLQTYLHPQTHCQASGYQACQALIAVGSGGLFGLGLGRSVQAYGYEPEANNDSIFAIYAETFGFIGSIVLLAIFAGLFSRLKNIAERVPDDFSRLVVVGIMAWLSIQAVINIGAMIGLLPLKGITLPFISYGGTSIVFVAAAIGIVFQISRYTSYQAPTVTTDNDRRPADDDRLNRRRLRGAYHPDPGSRS
jgi:cell division protein FtsW